MSKWFINEDGVAYDYDPATQERHFPGDDHTPYDTEAEANAAADAQDAARAHVSAPEPASGAPRLHFVPGDVRVSSISLDVDHDDVCVYYVDCSTKRAEAGIHDDFHFPDPRNLAAEIEKGFYLDVRVPDEDDSGPGTTPTRFFLRLPEDQAPHWHALISGGRYGWRMVFYRDSRDES